MSTTDEQRHPTVFVYSADKLICLKSDLIESPLPLRDVALNERV